MSWGAIRRAVAALALLFLAATPARAHDLSYALVEISVPAERNAVRIDIRCHAPALILGAPQGHLDPGRLAVFLALDDAQLAARQAVATRALRAGLSLSVDGRLIENLSLAFPPAAVLRADAQVPAASPKPSAPLRLTAALPPGAASLDLALPAALGPTVVVVRWPDGRVATLAMRDGERTRPIRLAGPDPLTDALDALIRFGGLGFRHILPLGLDHIAFIAALAVAAPRLGGLIRLATVFTLAHSFTLALAALRIIEAPAALVEPAIALSIVALAGLTAIRGPTPAGPAATAVVFGFGLLHGLGFAGALGQFGLPRGQEALALVGFNLGVEAGQIAVILMVLALVAAWRSKPFYATRIAQPASALIAVAGLVWTVQRIGGLAGGAPVFGAG
ncbi:HupE/UreJ family protein [Phenylobacterium sp.]|uniref:HupE/UreJ family protein n=1 Tax=Phenylobacterium sp. TaxID=1871053 RepID=UPI0037CB38DE